MIIVLIVVVIHMIQPDPNGVTDGNRITVAMTASGAITTC